MPEDESQCEESRTFKPWPEQDANGVDLSLIRSNMRLTHTERIRKADRFLRDMERIRKAQPVRTQKIAERLRNERG